mgnify:CR=1 FL=1
MCSKSCDDFVVYHDCLLSRGIIAKTAKFHFGNLLHLFLSILHQGLLHIVQTYNSLDTMYLPCHICFSWRLHPRTLHCARRRRNVVDFPPEFAIFARPNAGALHATTSASALMAVGGVDFGRQRRDGKHSRPSRGGANCVGRGPQAVPHVRTTAGDQRPGGAIRRRAIGRH